MIFSNACDNDRRPKISHTLRVLNFDMQNLSLFSFPNITPAVNESLFNDPYVHNFIFEF